MKQKMWNVINACSKGSIELAFYSFIWLPLAFYSLTLFGTICWLLLMLLSYSSFSFLLANKKATYFNVIGIALSNTVIISLLLFFQLQSHHHVVLYILLIILTFMFSISGYRQYGMQFKNSFSIPFMGISFSGHIVLQIIKTVWLKQMVEINFLLYLFGVLSLILIMFITNERMLADQQKLIGQSTAHKQALHMNRMLISIFSVIMVSIIIFRSWQEKIEAWIKQLLNWFIGLFNKEPGEKAIEEELEPISQQFPFGAGEEPTQSWLLQLLEKLLVIIAYIAFGIILIVLMYLIVKLIGTLVKKILTFLNKDASKLEDENLLYIDEIEEIEKAPKKRRRKRNISSRSKAHWKTMSILEKCQYLYVLFIRRAEQEGHQYIKHLTVNEQVNYVIDKFSINLSAEESIWLTRIYNEARYGQFSEASLPVSEEQIEKLYRKFLAKRLGHN